jgi:hypothetical protein
MGDVITDYEDLTKMGLDDEQLEALVGSGGECVFSWTTSDGFPVGVVVAYIRHQGRFWTTCAARRKRVPALRARPQSAIVVNQMGKTASFKGTSVVHAPGDPGWDELKSWFYAALSGTAGDATNVAARNFEKFLDSPHRVIIETDAKLVVSFDAAKFAALTQEAVDAGLGVD